MTKKIHINLPETIHKKLRIKCATKSMSIQQYVQKIIENNLKNRGKKV